MATALLGVSELFIQSLENISRVELGFDADSLATFRVSPGLSGYSPERSAHFFEELKDELAAVPGVTGVTSAQVPLLADSSLGSDVTVEGFDADSDIDSNARTNAIGPAFFNTMGIDIIAGREFSNADARGVSNVAIVNEKFADKFNLGHDVMGKYMAVGRDSSLDIEIVGLVKNTKYSAVKGQILPQYYTPHRQGEGIGSRTFYVRTGRDPNSVLTEISDAVAGIDPNLPVENLKTMSRQIHDNLFLDRFVSVVSTAFAVLATLLASIGLYGVLTYSVARRYPEIGLRSALGADPGRLRFMVFKHVGIMALIGGVLGLIIAEGLRLAAQSLFFELGATEPSVLGAVAGLIFLIVLGAGYLPARRASRVQPMEILRYE